MKKTRIIRWIIVVFIIVLTMSTTSMATIDEATKVYKEWENFTASNIFRSWIWEYGSIDGVPMYGCSYFTILPTNNSRKAKCH